MADTLKSTKTEAILFTLKQIECFPNLIFNNIPIQFVEAHKHLGFTWVTLAMLVVYFVLSFFHVLNEIWDLVGMVSIGFPAYS